MRRDYRSAHAGVHSGPQEAHSSLGRVAAVDSGVGYRPARHDADRVGVGRRHDHPVLGHRRSCRGARAGGPHHHPHLRPLRRPDHAARRHAADHARSTDDLPDRCRLRTSRRTQRLTHADPRCLLAVDVVLHRDHLVHRRPCFAARPPPARPLHLHLRPHRSGVAGSPAGPGDRHHRQRCDVVDTCR